MTLQGHLGTGQERLEEPDAAYPSIRTFYLNRSVFITFFVARIADDLSVYKAYKS